MKKLVLLTCMLSFALLTYSQTRIRMQKEGGVYTIPCTVNGLKLRFIFDTGASNVSISLSEAVFMLKNDYLNANDIVGSGKSIIADGSIVENTKIILREIEIGGLRLTNVEATVVHNTDAPLLLGQTAIQKLGRIEIDGNELVITKTTQYSGQTTNAYDSNNAWVEVYSNENIKIDVHNSTMIRDGNFVTFWVQWTFLSDELKKEMINKAIELESSSSLSELYAKWNNFSYQMVKTIYDCRNNIYANISIVCYDKDGKVIESTNFDNIEWKNIPSGGFGKVISNYVCRNNNTSNTSNASRSNQSAKPVATNNWKYKAWHTGNGVVRIEKWNGSSYVFVTYKKSRLSQLADIKVIKWALKRELVGDYKWNDEGTILYFDNERNFKEN